MDTISIYECDKCGLELNRSGKCPSCDGNMVYKEERKIGLTEGNGSDPDEDEDE